MTTINSLEIDTPQGQSSLNGHAVPQAYCNAIRAHCCRRPAGSILKLEGDTSTSVFLLLSGWMAINKALPDGDKQIMDFLLASETIDPASADQFTSSVEVEALTDVSLSIIPRDAWRQLLATQGQLRMDHERRLAAARARLSEHLLRLGKASAEARIAYALIELYMRLKKNDPVCNGETFHLPLTQQQLGDFTGLSSVHVCRTLRRLKRHGLVETQDHMDVVIHDIDALAQTAKVDIAELHREIIPAA